MAIFKCKMCGGDLDVLEGSNIAECEYCGTKQPVPLNTDDEQENLFNRANALRMKCEFDKAETQYEKILDKDNTQADAYWGLILCKYGIEYVDDPATRKKIPTCHRASYDSIIADEDYKSAIKYADMSQRLLYEQQAKEIDRIQKDILALAQNEETYDVFICYKETDANGQRTRDSVVANEIYHQLTQEGFKVFYAAITLEGKLGSAYEPIIFAALNSAKVMLVIGTKPEYFNAVWVKNEWSRFLKIIQKDHSKMLIPCYRDMDAYDLPDEFAHLQAQDMSKIGFVNDLIRGIKKVAKKKEAKQPAVVKETVITKSPAGDVAPILKRVFIFLEDGDWPRADEYCEKALDIDPECARAYLGKLMIDLRLKKEDQFQKLDRPFESNKYYQKVMQYGKEPWVWNLKEANKKSIERAEENRQSAIYKEGLLLANQKTPEKQLAAAKEFERVRGYRDAATRALECRHQAKVISYNRALKVAEKATTAQDFEAASQLFHAISDYPPAKAKAEECIAKAKQMIEAKRIAQEMAETERKNGAYWAAIDAMNTEDIDKIEEAILRFQSLGSWRDSEEKVAECKSKIAAIKEIQLQRRAAQIRAEKQRKKKRAITSTIIISSVLACIAFVFVIFTVIIPGQTYNNAIALMNAGKYQEAIGIFEQMEDYKDSIDKKMECYQHLGRYSVIISHYGYTEYTIPDGVTNIGDGAFMNCTNLVKVTIPDSVTNIGSNAFYNCTSLESITIPDSVTSIGGNAFSGCTNLTSITIGDGVTSINYSMFEGCTSLTSITIPWGITSIASEAFRDCTSLQSITIPSGVTSIGDKAFWNCTSLESVIIPSSVLRIGEWAFYDCTNLNVIACRASQGYWSGLVSKGWNWDATNSGHIMIYDYTGE